MASSSAPGRAASSLATTGSRPAFSAASSRSMLFIRPGPAMPCSPTPSSTPCICALAPGFRTWTWPRWRRRTCSFSRAWVARAPTALRPGPAARSGSVWRNKPAPSKIVRSPEWGGRLEHLPPFRYFLASTGDERPELSQNGVRIDNLRPVSDVVQLEQTECDVLRFHRARGALATPRAAAALPCRVSLALIACHGERRRWPLARAASLHGEGPVVRRRTNVRAHGEVAIAKATRQFRSPIEHEPGEIELRSRP